MEKNIIEKDLSLFDRLRKKIISAKRAVFIQLMTLFMSLAPCTAYAAAPATMQDVANGIINVILEIAKYAGLVIIVAGAIMVVVAFKNDNAESQTNGVKFILIGAALAFLKSVLTAAGLM